MDKYMERQLDDVIHYAKQKAECIIKFKEIQQKLRSIRLEFESKVQLVGPNWGDEKLLKRLTYVKEFYGKAEVKQYKDRYHSYSKMLHDYFDIIKSYDRMYRKARKDFTSDVDTISRSFHVPHTNQEYKDAG